MGLSQPIAPSALKRRISRIQFEAPLLHVARRSAPEQHQPPLAVPPGGDHLRRLHRRHAVAVDLVDRQEEVAHIDDPAQRTVCLDGVHERESPRDVVQDDPDLARGRDRDEAPGGAAGTGAYGAVLARRGL